MIISHKYKYLFIELPRTGTTAISKELRERYAGELIYEKHTKYEKPSLATTLSTDSAFDPSAQSL